MEARGRPRGRHTRAGERRSSRPPPPALDRRACLKQVSKILRKSECMRSAEERAALASMASEAREVAGRLQQRQRTAERARETEDDPAALRAKCAALASAVQRARHLIVYTGAGISTAADIPDYRGPNGIWTRLQQGKQIGSHDLSKAQPTFTHMALRELHRRRLLKFVVSQNCDGLHLRSGLPRRALAEVHGNMYVEVCARCKPCVPYWRLFDTTERTARYNHRTARICHYCTHSLTDTIVHFGERGKTAWPLNWAGALRHASAADVILCLGSSLKVLRRYPWLWAMDRPPARRPKLFIVNLQWTPKDDAAELKINGKCDAVMRLLMERLRLAVPEYERGADPIFVHATPLSPRELHTTARAMLARDPAARGLRRHASGDDTDDDCPLLMLRARLERERRALKREGAGDGGSTGCKLPRHAASSDHPSDSEDGSKCAAGNSINLYSFSDKLNSDCTLSGSDPVLNRLPINSSVCNNSSFTESIKIKSEIEDSNNTSHNGENNFSQYSHCNLANSDSQSMYRAELDIHFAHVNSANGSAIRRDSASANVTKDKDTFRERFFNEVTSENNNFKTVTNKCALMHPKNESGDLSEHATIILSKNTFPKCTPEKEEESKKCIFTSNEKVDTNIEMKLESPKGEQRCADEELDSFEVSMRTERGRELPVAILLLSKHSPTKQDKSQRASADLEDLLKLNIVSKHRCLELNNHSKPNGLASNHSSVDSQLLTPNPPSKPKLCDSLRNFRRSKPLNGSVPPINGVLHPINGLRGILLADRQGLPDRDSSDAVSKLKVLNSKLNGSTKSHMNVPDLIPLTAAGDALKPIGQHGISEIDKPPDPFPREHLNGKVARVDEKKEALQSGPGRGGALLSLPTERTRLVASEESDSECEALAQAIVQHALVACRAEMRRLYSGLHSIVAPARLYVDYESGADAGAFARRGRRLLAERRPKRACAERPRAERAAKRERSARRRDPECLHCHRNYGSYRCAFYRPHNSDERAEKKVNGKKVMCDCCGQSDSSDEEGSSGGGGEAKAAAGAVAERAVAERAAAEACAAGWFGKGYRKGRRRKR